MATVLQDDFSDANGTDISGKALDVGGNWTVLSGTWRVQDGKCEKTNLSASLFNKIVADAGAADVTAQVEMTTHATLDSVGGLILRSLNDTNNWWVYLSAINDTIKIYEFNAGSLTERASAAFTVSASTTYTIKAVLSGNTITAYIDDVEKCSYGSATFQNTETDFGVLTVRNDTSIGNTTFDNFLVTTPGAGATTYTFEGPTSGLLNVASTNFTVTPDADADGIEVTPASDGSGTFTPTSVTFTGSGAETFTYTPTSITGSPHTLSVTNDGALTDPASIDYTVTTGTVAITTPVQYQTFQRDGSDEADIPITGTYTGSPTAIEASFNGGAYVTIDAAPAGGTYSGTLSGQAAGQGTLTVRFTNDTGVTATKADIGIGDVFIIAGQSNAEGYGTNNQIYTHATLKATKFTQADTWGDGVDPTDSNAGGSFWPLLATYLMADQSVPVAFITTAANDTGLHNGDWQQGGTHYNNMLSQVTQSGVNAVKAVLWLQGERDALDSVTRAEYLADIVELASDIVTDVPGAPKTLVIQMGDNTFPVTTDMDAIRLAQQDSWANANIYEGPCLYDIDLDDGAGDGVHFKTDAELLEGAKRIWACVDAALYGGSASAPQISTATAHVDRDQITVEFDQSLDSGLTYTPGAWTVLDDGTPTDVVAVHAHASNAAKVILTLEGEPAGADGTLTLSLALGRTGAGAVVPRSADISLPTSGTTNLAARVVKDFTVTETSGGGGGGSILGSSIIRGAW